MVGAGGDDDGKSDGTCLELDGVEIKNSSDQGQDFFWRQSGVMCLIRCVRFAFLWFFEDKTNGTLRIINETLCIRRETKYLR